MCHNSGIESEQQIERFMACGLPPKAIKKIKYTLRKREKSQQKLQQLNNNDYVNVNSSTTNSSCNSSSDGVSDEEQQLLVLTKANGNQHNGLEDLNKPQKCTGDVVDSCNNSSTNSNACTSDIDLQPGSKVECTAANPTMMQLETKDTGVAHAESELDLNAADVEVTAVTTLAANVTADVEQPTVYSTAAKAAIVHKKSSSSIRSELLKIPRLCGRFRKMQQLLEQQEKLEQQQQQQQVEATNTTEQEQQQQQQQEQKEQQRKLSSMEPSMDDVLAIGTQMTRKFTERIYCTIGQVQGSRLYTILTRTTQPAHLIAICILSFVLLTVGPDLIDSNNSNIIIGKATNANAMDTDGHGSRAAGSTWANIVYLGAFATHFGSQIWMTFVSGLSLYFSLPRHTFGQCQQILFPKYFALNAMLSISMLIIYVKYFLSSWTTAAGIQLATLALMAAIEVVVRLYLAPPMLRLMHEKYKIEGAIGSGQEVGSLVQGDLIQCPHYQRIHKSFRRIHMTIAVGNMTVLLATCLQLYFLASKIRIS